MRSAPTNSEVKAGIVEIDRLFSQKSTKNIPLADIHKATSRIYSESMIKLNALNQRLAEIKAIPLPRNANNEVDTVAETERKVAIKLINDQISSLKTSYNAYFEALQQNIIASCKDTSSLKIWLETAMKCRDIGDDMLGYAIRNAILSPAIQNKFKKDLDKSDLYRDLRENKFDKATNTVTDAYFESFFSPGNYKRRITAMKGNMPAVSPALQFSFTIIDAANTRESENEMIIFLKKSLTPEIWKAALLACKGKDIKEDTAAIAKILAPYHSQYAGDVYSLIALCKNSYENIEAKFKAVESYFQKKSEQGEMDPFLAKLATAINASIVNANAPLFPEIALPTIKATTAPAPQKPVAPEFVGPPVKTERINLLTPKGMITRYNSIVDQLGIDRSGKLKSNFAHNMAPIAAARARIAPPLKVGMPTTQQIKDALDNQNMDQQSLLNELKYATRIKQALDELRSKNVSPERFDILATSFNHQLKRIKASANALGDVESAKAASNLLILPNNMPAQPAITASRAKEKEELSAPAKQVDNIKPSTTEKRQYLTKTIGGFFNRPGIGGNDTSPGAENKKSTTRRNTK